MVYVYLLNRAFINTLYEQFIPQKYRFTDSNGAYGHWWLYTGGS